MTISQASATATADCPQTANDPAAPGAPVRGRPAQVQFGIDLELSVSRRQLSLVYQPRVDLTTMETVSVEALLRWRHPQSGTIMPEDFIPHAEATGLITLIGDWVLDAAARQAALWRRLGMPMKTAINVSAAQIEQPDFTGKVAQVLRRHQLSAADIELEVTESMLPDDRDSAGRNARRLRRAGIDLAIDDFGAGVAGIDTLKWLPAGAIKLDKSLIDHVDSDPRQGALVGGLIGLAHAVDAISIAEGVETKSQMDTLKSLGCDQVQGFLLSRPVPWQDVEAGFCWFVGDEVEAGD